VPSSFWPAAVAWSVSPEKTVRQRRQGSVSPYWPGSGSGLGGVMERAERAYVSAVGTREKGG
jgi:hypothetical protein